MSDRVTTFNISDAARPAHGSDGATFGSMIYVSGQGALGENNEVLYPGDIAAQTRHVVERIDSIVAAAGGTLRDVISVAVFLQDASDFAAYDTAYGVAFGGHLPTRTTVRTDLLVPGMLIEASAVALRKPT